MHAVVSKCHVLPFPNGLTMKLKIRFPAVNCDSQVNASADVGSSSQLPRRSHNDRCEHVRSERVPGMGQTGDKFIAGLINVVVVGRVYVKTNRIAGSGMGFPRVCYERVLYNLTLFEWVSFWGFGIVN